MKQTIISVFVGWLILVAIGTPTLIIPTVILENNYGTWAIIYPISVLALLIIYAAVSNHFNQKGNAWRMKP